MKFPVTIINTLKTWIRDISMKQKIQLISIGCLVLLVLASYFIQKLQIVNYNHLLQDSVSASLNYANNDLTEKLENTNQLSYAILSDASLQSMLGALKKSPPNTLRAEYYTQITSSLHSYFQNHQKDFISYISLYTDSFACHTNAKKAGALNEEQIESILSSAQSANGKAVWVTDYAPTHGLILTREIRQYENLTLDPLGTLVLCINLDAMLSSCPMFISYDSFYYLIEDSSDQLIYSTMGNNITLPDSFQDNQGDRYQLVKINRHWFFALQGEFYQKGWKYTCLVSYDSIYQTLQNNLRLSVLLLIGCIVLITLFSRKLIESYTQHFGYLIKKMQHFASSKDSLTNFDFESTYDYSGRKDEVGMLHQQFDQMAHQISDLVELNYTKELLVKEAQLNALEMQINPHFLYNTLESINWRAKAIGASTISLMVESLGNLFRAILHKSGDSFTIQEEIALVENYLNIQKCRFESMLNCKIEVNPVLYPSRVPKMIIQPLVENAILHAMENLIEECFIEISILTKEDKLQIFVRNTGSLFEDHLLEKLQNETVIAKGFGIGLLNIDKRIKLMFGPSYGLTLYNENEMAVALITMPYTEQEEKNYVETDYC